MSTFDLKTYLAVQRELVNTALKDLVPAAEGPSSRVTDAMMYSLMAGGKRVRPILLLAGAQAAGGDGAALLPAACALECIHTYSLVHDDLPAMDDDDLRRGKPTCHTIYGEAVAILAGDGLLTLAFEMMTTPAMRASVPPAVLNEAISVLAQAAGVPGMVGGQTADILFEGKAVDADTLAFIHSHKTGALIRASVEIGGILAQGSQEMLDRLRLYGTALGLTFQIVDDLLDVEGDREALGKPVGSDARKQKATYPSLFGIPEARRRAYELLDQAEAALETFGQQAEPLRAIARYVVERDR